jgi:23S rRNA (cytidine1920-2'-O)/16S rRNA (cytidine1409-2'-O)-methyltransferase
MAAARSSHKTRIDHLMVERGLTDSRQKAQALILAGQVLADQQKVEKCGQLVAADVPLRILGDVPRYVSRAGIKLEGALEHFGVDPSGKTCADIGASTGGFTDCLLQRGAVRVYAIDVGTNQLDWKLRNHPRVISMEKTNARYLEPGAIGEPVDLVTVDVSFISATIILPVVPALLRPRADILVLAKPQFEAGRGLVGKGGVVSDPRLHQQAVERVARKLAQLGFDRIDSDESVLPGAGGNREFFVHAVRLEAR